MYADRLFNALERNDPAPGQLLVAAPDTLAPHYNRSVILITEQHAGRTYGVDLTKRSEVAVFNVMPEWLPVVAKPQALYIGGPHDQQAAIGVALTKQGVDIEKQPSLSRLAPRVALVDLRVGPDAVTELVEGMRLFAGHFEWGPGELDEEIDRGEWYVAPALPQDVVSSGSTDTWSDVMRRQAMPLPLFATFPRYIDEDN
ncbi:YqgE/AlgH family protein [Corynebacterium aurimucosum]|uniref:YqgE/AlgH family protein n=1 Tax=Corynebacterium aurimucosum TaxID=169292 RepID=UPI00191CBBD0|nr:YqgE/AlgH family protein [Corynebacterium aurimucosum]QQU96104.1 YqgE/AlgH family protein [Corynebacterium aurimucosum]UTA71007.1 YqgE/AlgH family protein [Corynebacterium aurimucosum]WJY71647.1 hypothetical protein CAURIM_12845 [Corynebacterium aurimucosum]